MCSFSVTLCICLPEPSTGNSILNIMLQPKQEKNLEKNAVFHSLSHARLCHTMDCSMPGFPGLHGLPEFAQTHVCWVSDTIQASHPLSLASLPALNLSQHPGLFQWVSSSHQVATVAASDTCICIIESLCYTPETNTTLLINYTLT